MNKSKRIIKVLFVVLITSILLILYVFVSGKYSIIKNNRIYAEDDEKLPTVYLHSDNPKDNKTIEVYDMFPGDEIYQGYNVQVHYKGNVHLHFSIDNFNESELRDVLKFTIKRENEVLFDDYASKLPDCYSLGLSSKDKKIQDVNYSITVSLDTSVGNEYQNKQVKFDLSWWATEDGGHLIPKTGIDGGALTNPNTYAILIVFISIIFIVFLARRKKEYE